MALLIQVVSTQGEDVLWRALDHHQCVLSVAASASSYQLHRGAVITHDYCRELYWRIGGVKELTKG